MKKSLEKDYFIPHEYNEDKDDYHEYLAKIYENRNYLYFIY